jgi:hypothetical protein
MNRRKAMQILKISVGDVLELKKPHPCGNKLFKVLRVGSDVRILCQNCGRDMTIDRIKLEKSVKSITNSPSIE